MLKNINKSGWLLSLTIAIVMCGVVEAQVPVSNNFKLRRIVIDAGHGGKDPGAIGKKGMEKDIALSIALKTGGLIKKYIPDVDVYYTRTTDKFIELSRRAEIANEIEADLFISIHVNANPDPKFKGTSTWVNGPKRAADNFDVAKRENAVILIEDNYKMTYEGYAPDDPESDIIFALMNNNHQDQSLLMAQKVQEQFKTRAGRMDRGVKQAGLVVLWKAGMPSILVETGHITNSKEETFITSEDGQDLLASAIYRAFKDYKKVTESRSGFVTSVIKDTNLDTIIEDQQQSTKRKSEDKTKKAKTEPLVDNNTKKKENVLKEKQIQKNSSTNADIVFRVQLKSSISPLDLESRQFKGESGIQELKIGKTYKYVWGETSNPDEALELQSTARTKFPDAFVVAFKLGVQITFKDAVKMIKGN